MDENPAAAISGAQHSLSKLLPEIGNLDALRVRLATKPFRVLLAYLFAFVISVIPSGRAWSQEPPAILAPTGTLRVGVYNGSPTSQVRSRSGDLHGLAVELGRELGRRLNVPVELIEYPRVAEVVDAIAAGRVDVTVTNASPARAEKVAFTEALLTLELGVLTPAGSTVSSLRDLDAPTRRIGVTQGSTSEKTLRGLLGNSAIVPAPSMVRAVDMLKDGSLDAYATNKSILFELSDSLPGSRVLDDRWGLEHLAIAYPQGRESAASFLASFVASAKDTGFVARAAERAGLRGQARPQP
jgi:polar amino acid transport system substrate-binding protein